MTSSQKVYLFYLFLGVFLSTINLSKGKCEDYFAVGAWNFPKNLSKSIALISANNSEDIVRCSLWKFCNCSNCTKVNPLCFIYNDCGYNKTDFKGNCSNTSLGNVTMFHIRCIIAKDKNKTDIVSQECGDYDQLINLYPQIFPKPEGGDHKSDSEKHNGEKETEQNKVIESLVYIIFLILSVILNIILLIGMYRYHQKIRGWSLQNTQNGIHEMTDNLMISETTSLNTNGTMGNLDSNRAMHQRFTTPPT